MLCDNKSYLSVASNVKNPAAIATTWVFTKVDDQNRRISGTEAKTLRLDGNGLFPALLAHSLGEEEECAIRCFITAEHSFPKHDCIIMTKVTGV